MSRSTASVRKSKPTCSRSDFATNRSRRAAVPNPRLAFFAWPPCMVALAGGKTSGGHRSDVVRPPAGQGLLATDSLCVDGFGGRGRSLVACLPLLAAGGQSRRGAARTVVGSFGPSSCAAHWRMPTDCESAAGGSPERKFPAVSRSSGGLGSPLDYSTIGVIARSPSQNSDAIRIAALPPGAWLRTRRG